MTSSAQRSPVSPVGEVAVAINGEPGWPDRFGESLSAAYAANGVSEVETLSLFSGGGGLDIGFHDAAFALRYAVEIEPKYVETLKANSGEGGYFEGLHALCEDIADYKPAPGFRPAFVIGGPPCQTFSAAGRRAAGVMGIDDPRGELFLQYARVLETLRPVGFVFENVYGIIGAQGGSAWAAIVSTFEELGYTVAHRILDSADFGVPQHRERLIIVGLRDGSFRFPFPTHGPDSPTGEPFYTARTAIADVASEDEEPSEGIGGRYGALLTEIPPGLNYSFFTEKLGHPRPVFAWRSKFSDFLYKADPEAPVRTIKAQGGQYTGPFSWENRRFTLAELKRLQTMPDRYLIEGGRQVAIEQIGNSVPPQLARILAIAIQHQVFGARPPFGLSYMSESHKLGFRTRKRLLTARYQEKAREAIAARGPTNADPSHLREGDWSAYLTADFALLPTASRPATQVVLQASQQGRAWTLTVKLAGETEPVDWFAIDVKPAVDWALPIDATRLVGRGDRPTLLTAVWKAFEDCVRESTGIADLVQLNGYYQYEPRLIASMELEGLSSPVWRALAAVTAGIGVGQVLAPRGFARAWNLGRAGTATACLRSLKSLGFEVRSHRTNPQLPPDYFLVPYAFPTLTPQSVQLRKQL
jgi:DNA (cytosine-5)-methyltransferase 1